MAYEGRDNREKTEEYRTGGKRRAESEGETRRYMDVYTERIVRDRREKGRHRM